MEYQGLQINHFEHSTFQIKAGGRVIYFDPYNLKDSQILAADFIFITHEHFDHCSKKDLEKIASPKTVVVSSEDCAEQLKGLRVKEVILVGAGQTLEWQDLQVEAVPAYNIDKFRSAGLTYHPQNDGQVGYVMEISGIRIYYAGDTDKIPEMAQLKNIDVALLPVSGTYVMTWREAAQAAKVIKPKLAIPMHYGSIIGGLADARKFKEAANCAVEII